MPYTSSAQVTADTNKTATIINVQQARHPFLESFATEKPYSVFRVEIHFLFSLVLPIFNSYWSPITSLMDEKVKSLKSLLSFPAVPLRLM